MSERDLVYLRGRMAVLEQRVRVLVEHRRAQDPLPDDPFRGLYVSDEAAARLLTPTSPAPLTEPEARRRVEQDADDAEQAGRPVRLRRLAGRAGLDDTDVELLLVAVLPDLDSRFEPLYGYLNDDVTRRRATVNLALTLVGISPISAEARQRLGPSGRLASQALVHVEEEDRPYLTRAVRVPDRVTSHLLGDETPAAVLRPYLVDPHPYGGAVAHRLARAVAGGVTVLHVRETAPGMGMSVAAAALQQLDRPVLALDLSPVVRDDRPLDVVVTALREALLTGAGLVAGPVDDLATAAPQTLRMLTSARVPVLLSGRSAWDPHWAPLTPMSVDVPQVAPDDQRRLWASHLGDAVALLDPVDEHLALAPGQVARAVGAARAAAAGGPLRTEHLHHGVRSQNTSGLERLARRIVPEVSWADLVVTPAVHRSLRELAARARHRRTVLTAWGMRRGGGRGTGVSALFAGDSGTGKTMAAEVIAADLGLDLYTVNLATVVDKYVGETEKNLERIFTEASGVNAVLFFDEADAVFGKRSAVRDAHDRYANIESAYLLQRLETFDGLAVLATNLRANIDDAFTRRLDMIVDFPSPVAELRRELWQRCLAPPLPVADDIDLDYCARSFELAGGNIRSASTTAAYLAADAGRPVGMAEVVLAIEQEYRKLGRLVLDREFGDYVSFLR